MGDWGSSFEACSICKGVEVSDGVVSILARFGGQDDAVEASHVVICNSHDNASF